jgi:transposase
MRQDPTLHLSTADRERLKQILEQGSVGAAALRATIILLSGLELSAAEIARTLRVTERLVRRCRHRWREGGWHALQDPVRSGRPALADKTYLQLLRRTAKKNPRQMGYAFSRWTTPRLATYMEEKTGVKLTSDYLSKLLRDRGLVWGKGKLTTANLADPGEKKISREMAKLAENGLEILGIQF